MSSTVLLWSVCIACRFASTRRHCPAFRCRRRVRGWPE